MPLETKQEMLKLLNETYTNKIRECSLIYGEDAVKKVKERVLNNQIASKKGEEPEMMEEARDDYSQSQ